MRTLKSEWESFSKQVIHKDAHPLQFRDMGWAFYAGALAMFSMMAEVSKSLPEDQASAAIEALNQELDEHANKIRRIAKEHLYGKRR